LEKKTLNKSEIVKVLAAYSPPLSSAQIEEVADKIVEIVAKEKETEPVAKEEPSRKSRR
jgi:hypothetical protein